MFEAFEDHYPAWRATNSDDAYYPAWRRRELLRRPSDARQGPAAPAAPAAARRGGIAKEAGPRVAGPAPAASGAQEKVAELWPRL